MGRLSRRIAIVTGRGHAVVFLVSDQARNIAGQARNVDVGIHTSGAGDGFPASRAC